MSGAALIVQGDALWLPLPDGSVDLIVFQSGDFGKAAGRTWKERQGSLI